MSKIKTKDTGSPEQEFINEIVSGHAGNKVLSCLQCGTCTATCPVSNLFDKSPRQIFLEVRNGRKEDALNNVTQWVCASCYKCTVNCPAQIKITEIMYQLKRMSVVYNMTSKKSNTRFFYAAFMDQVLKYGRSYEIGLMIRYLLFYHPVNLVKQVPVGIKMLMSGAMPILPHKIKDRSGLGKMVKRSIELEKF